MIAIAPAERMAVTISKLLADGELVGTGAASEIPMAACLLAKGSHAPSLQLAVGGVYFNPSSVPEAFAAGSSVECEYVGDFQDVFTLTEQGVDVMFYSGLQIDQHGNVNLHRVGSATPRLGPGLANTSFGHTARRTILWCPSHEPRRLVEKVEFTSVVGHRWRGQTRGELDIPNHGPTHLITDRVVFTVEDGRFVPSGWFGRGKWEEVRALTGWWMPAEPPELVPEPSETEIRDLRTRVDPAGTLRRLHAANRG